MQTMLSGRGSGGRMRTLKAQRRCRCRRLLRACLVFAEALDQAADEVMRAGVRDVAHDVHHVDHGVVALQHAELEIVEEEQLHVSVLPGMVRRVYRPLVARMSPVKVRHGLVIHTAIGHNAVPCETRRRNHPIAATGSARSIRRNAWPPHSAHPMPAAPSTPGRCSSLPAPEPARRTRWPIALRI